MYGMYALHVCMVCMYGMYVCIICMYNMYGKHKGIKPGFRRIWNGFALPYLNYLLVTNSQRS